VLRREPAARPAEPPRGLCVQCRLADDCTFGPRLAGRAVRSCDEFEGGRLRPDLRATAQLGGPGRTNGTRPRLGLCANCGAWEGCTFPKPDDGVWSCDEYV
jgi:hypothetical protein